MENYDEKQEKRSFFSMMGGFQGRMDPAGMYLEMPLNHRIFLAQFDAIRKIADKGPCVIVGRCADYVLRDHENVLNVFIKASMEERVKRITKLYDLDPLKAEEMAQLIRQVKSEGDTIGGVITCVVKGCRPGIGEPEFGKLHATLGAAMLSINAVKGFEYGDGFEGVSKRGSEVNDRFTNDNGTITTTTNHSGGIQGGISNGQDIYFRVAFKPVATLLQAQETVDIEGNATTLTARGRHDPCVLPRAVPIVESMAAMTILDQYLSTKSQF